MAAITWFTLRPLERPVHNSVLDQQSFRVHLTQKELKNQGLNIEDKVKIISSKGFHGYAIAWLARESNPGNKPIARIGDVLREKYRLNLSDTIYFEKSDEVSEPLASVTVRFAPSSDATRRFTSTEYLRWRTGFGLEELDLILPGCAFDVHLREGMCQHGASKLRATVESFEPPPKDSQRFHFDPFHTQLNIANSDPAGAVPANPDGNLELSGHGIGGMSHLLDTINSELSILNDPSFEAMDKSDLGPTTFLIHGQKGSGKTFLLNRFAESPWQRVSRVDQSWLATNRKNMGEALAEVFRTARAHQPSLILMDDLEKLLKKSEDMARVLQGEIEKIEGTRVVVAAATRNVLEIDESLRDSLAFQTELEIFPPNASQREEILRQRLESQEKRLNVDLPILAERTHGFLAQDLWRLCRLARKRCVHRIKNSMTGGTSSSLAEALESHDWVDQQDIDAVIDQVHGTVLKDSIIEVPKIRWADIAGVDHVRKELEAITVRPYKYPNTYAKFNVRNPRKGVLLFGPPGCAKTLIAQAVATESNQNFLAVKGSELIKMYVGESERAIRDVFRRARAAKPCIIFFDEIDSIGKSRESQENSGLNVVTTLLNEMDGIEALRDVFIIGATNRPDILDSALIRSGRFDAHIYIGLPNEEARRQIFKIHTRGQPLAADVDLDTLASQSDSRSGAEIAGVCAKAVELAIDDCIDNPDLEPEIHMHHFTQVLRKQEPQTNKEEAARFEGWHPGKPLSAAT